jgi:hypothetical protein
MIGEESGATCQERRQFSKFVGSRVWAAAQVELVWPDQIPLAKSGLLGASRDRYCKHNKHRIQ